MLRPGDLVLIARLGVYTFSPQFAGVGFVSADQVEAEGTGGVCVRVIRRLRDGKVRVDSEVVAADLLSVCGNAVEIDADGRVSVEE